MIIGVGWSVSSLKGLLSELRLAGKRLLAETCGLSGGDDPVADMWSRQTW